MAEEEVLCQQQRQVHKVSPNLPTQPGSEEASVLSLSRIPSNSNLVVAVAELAFFLLLEIAANLQHTVDIFTLCLHASTSFSCR